MISKENGWINNPKVILEIGRVDDRCYTGTSDDIMLESELLKFLYEFNKKQKFPKNIKLAFVKTSLALAQRFHFDFNQNEPGRRTYHYCWSATPVDNIQYIDKNFNVYRCTYTVGKPGLAIKNLKGKPVLASEKMFERSSFIEKCWDCPLGGFCGGGCCVSSHINQERFCKEEKKNFDFLIKELIIPILKQKLKKKEQNA